MHPDDDNGRTARPGELRQRFARLTFLNIVSNITVPLASLVDTALLGHLEGIHFLAGVALAAVIFEYVYWSFGFLRMGTTGITAQALTRLFRLNRDILLRTVALISAFALFTNFSSLLSTVILAANAVLLRWVMLAAYLIDGAAFATESLAGILFGTGDRVALRRLQSLALRSGVAFALPFCVLALIRPTAPIRLLTSHPQTVETALQYIPWLAPVLLFGSLAYIYDGLFLGLTAGQALRNAMLLSTLGVFLPLAALALHFENNHLLWASLAAFMLARAATLWKASGAFFTPPG